MRLRGGLVESMCVVVVLRVSRFDRTGFLVGDKEGKGGRGAGYVSLSLPPYPFSTYKILALSPSPNFQSEREHR